MAHHPSQYDTECGLTYTWHPTPGDDTPPAPGHYIISSGGAVFGIVAIREIKTREPVPRDGHKYAIRAMRTNPAEVPIYAVIHPMYWHRR